MKKSRCWILFLAGLLVGCEKNPSDGLVSPNQGNAVPFAGAPFIIYDDALETGGGVDFFPSAQNQQLSFTSTDNPHSGKRCMSYTWSGSDVPNGATTEHTFVGFDLLVSANFSTLATTPGRNLSAAGYTKLTFWARGTLSENTTFKVEGPGTGDQSTFSPIINVATLTNSWQEFTINAGPGDFNNVKEFFKLTFLFTQPTGTTVAGQGGTIFVDDIHFEK